MARWAWMWKIVCSLVWHWIPSTVWPVAAVLRPASCWALGIGNPSGPVGPAGGSGLSVPSVLSAASLSLGEHGPEPLLLPVTASVMPTAAAATMTTAPMLSSQVRFRLRRASSARCLAIFSRAACLFLSPLDTCAYPLVRPVTYGG